MNILIKYRINAISTGGLKRRTVIFVKLNIQANSCIRNFKYMAILLKT